MVFEWIGLLCYENKIWLNMYDLDSKTFYGQGKKHYRKISYLWYIIFSNMGDNTKIIYQQDLQIILLS